MALALVVEDDEDVRGLFSAALEEVGFVVLTSASVRQALKILESNTPDIAFIDLNLPERSGTEVLQYIKQTPRLSDTKAVIVTANNLADSRVNEMGADLFLVKPVMISEMVQLAKRLTGG